MEVSYKSLFHFFLIIVLVNNFIIGSNVLANDYNSTNIANFKYRQEIKIPIDTSLAESKFQPIDIRIKFDNNCWGINETQNSVRVAYEDGSGLNEVESQIYDLEQSGNSDIISCSLVFLIPKEANGNEKYYVLYHDSEVDGPNYEDHLSIIDTHYFYEPISGQKMDFDYYQISEDGYIVYAVCQKGGILDNGMSNAVIKMKPNTTEFEPINSEQLATFYCSYSTDPSGESDGSQLANDIKKSVLINGNLMIRLKVEGLSPNGEVKTDNIYTYYYSRESSKSIDVNIKHELLKTTQITGNQEKDCTYASLATFKARSATIKNMNFGNILPKIHFISEEDNLKVYDMPVDPNADPAEWTLSSVDDDDLGNKAWICMDDPNTGMAQALIFETNVGILEGENDGIQIKASTEQHVKLPGLEADTGDVFACRNAYENGNHNTVLEKGLTVNFNLEFATFEKGGYEAVDKESEIFQLLVPNRPIYRSNVSNKFQEEKERYSLTSFVHFAPTFPLGSLLSAATGKNFSYTYIELYKDNIIKSSGSSSRLPVGDVNLEFDNTTFMQKIKIVFGLFDWKNISFFKKIVFPDLEEGIYLIKVFKENPSSGQHRKYIGFSVVDLTKNTTIRIYCKPQCELFLSISDEEKKGIEDVDFRLIDDDTTISDSVSDKNGSGFLYAPSNRREPYLLRIIYDGFLIEEKNIKLKPLNSIFSVKESFTADLYDLTLNVKDKLGLAPAVDISPYVTSEEMFEICNIRGEMKSYGHYELLDLFPSNYILKTGYKSFTEERFIEIDGDKTINIEFPAEYKVDFNVFNSYGMRVSNGKITMTREGKSVSTNIKDSGDSVLSIPPGNYHMRLVSDNEEVGMQRVDVKGEKSLDLVTSQGSLLHSLILYIGIILIIFSFYYIWKYDAHKGLKILSIALIIISVFLPWWVLTGESEITSTSSEAFLFPSSIVTLTRSNEVIGGDISIVNEDFTMILGLLIMLISAFSISIIINLIISDKFPRINKLFMIAGIVLLLVVIVLFYFVMSQVTEIGVGSFSGEGDLNISIPGFQENEVLTCYWGPGFGFYLSILSFISLICFSLYKFFKGFKLSFKE